MAERLSVEDISQRVEKLGGWTYQEGELMRQFTFKDFSAAMKFINQVATLAEEANHHPDIDIRWNKVRLGLTTHSRGGVTNLDFELAEKINLL